MFSLGCPWAAQFFIFGKWGTVGQKVEKSGYLCQAVFLFGEYSARLDAKRRFVLPSALLSLLPEGNRTDFVLQRAPDPCLWLYPLSVWKSELEKIHEKINLFTPEGRNFARLFQSGAQPVSLDTANRLVLPKPFCDYAGIAAEIILLGMKDRIEIWAQEPYERWKSQHEAHLSEWTQRFLGT
ncbi:MAG: hypothetical protein KatS3mg025_0250 [Bacteroidia bacterium]|jgi:MraZ protein|nr:MAG: hypothetical protein KatS3mg025_0250 [Bacteroidia bacterium]